MVYPNTTIRLEKLLMKFMTEPDPIQAMLEWLCKQLMEAEVSIKPNATKSKHTENRSSYRSGYRVRRFDTRMGTIYLMVPKVRNGGYIPFFFFVRERLALLALPCDNLVFVNPKMALPHF